MSGAFAGGPQERPRLLFVTHGLGGGVSRHIDELCEGIGERAEVLLLQGAGEFHVALRRHGAAEEETLWIRRDEWHALLRRLEALAIDRVHYHHVHGLPMEVLELPRALGCPHDVTLHDFYPACPAYHLKDARLRFCGGGPGCRKCDEAGPPQWPVTVAQWRERMQRMLVEAERVIAPSQDAARRLQEFFPAVTPVVSPHPTERDAAPTRCARILVPGAISLEKGLDVLEACARDAAQRGLALHFHVVGFTARPVALWPELPLTVGGEYPEGALPALLASAGGDALFFPVQCPETFSYTLSAALATGLPIVATDLGAFPERLAARAGCRIVPWAASARELNDAIVSVTTPAAERAPPEVLGIVRYADAYLGPVSRLPRKAAALPALDPAWRERPVTAARPSPLAWLYDDGVLAGRAASRAQLRSRAEHVEAALEAATAESQRARAALAQQASEMETLKAQLSLARAEARRSATRAATFEDALTRLESSRSWRLLAPVRALARKLRLTRTDS